MILERSLYLNQHCKTFRWIKASGIFFWIYEYILLQCFLNLDENERGLVRRGEGCRHFQEEKFFSLLEQCEKNTSSRKTKCKQAEQSEGEADGDVMEEWRESLPSGNRWGMPYSFLINNGYTHFFWGGLVTDFFIIDAHVQGEAGRSLGNKQKSNIRMLFGRFFKHKKGSQSQKAELW